MAAAPTTPSTLAKPPQTGSEVVTDGLRVTVRPSYSTLDSDPANNYFKFVYRIRIRNESPHTVQLLSRHWVIVDADGEKQEVRGDGVVGQQPVLEPGQAFEYASFCPLSTTWGTMEGAYRMRRRSAGEAAGDTGTMPEFDVKIARFFLVCPTDAATADALAEI